MLALLLGGCAAPLPKYPPMDARESLEVMRTRDSAIRSVQSECDLSLKDATGSSVSFDAAIVAEWPDRLRLRAWKFGHAAFDLTFTPDGLWMYIPDEARKHAGPNARFDLTAEQFGRVWNMIGPAALAGADVAESTATTLRASRPVDASGHAKLEFDIDRATLTVTEYRFIDVEGRVRESLKMGNYRLFKSGESEVVWPGRIAAEGESGRIFVRFIDPEFNAALPEGAFTPPARATKQP